jgi:hypothetical protein
MKAVKPIESLGKFIKLHDDSLMVPITPKKWPKVKFFADIFDRTNLDNLEFSPRYL